MNDLSAFFNPKSLYHFFFRWNWSWLTVRRRTNNRLQQEKLLIFYNNYALRCFHSPVQLKAQCHALCNLFKEGKHVTSNSHGSVSWFKTLLSAMKLFPCWLQLRMARMDIWIKTWRNWADFLKFKKFNIFFNEIWFISLSGPSCSKGGQRYPPEKSLFTG